MNNTNQAQQNTKEQTQQPTLADLVISQRSAHKSRSSQYSVITSEDVLKMFEAEGFTYRMISQEKPRKETYKGFGTHLIALESSKLVFEDPTLSMEIQPRIYLKNSYHGRTSFTLDLGLYRVYCRNGLILGTQFKSIQLRHIRLNQAIIKETVAQIENEYKNRVVPLLKALKQTEMSKEDQNLFAEMALKLRMRSCKTYVRGEHEQLLISNRSEDNGNGMWEVLQRVQENLGLNFRGNVRDVSYTYLSKDKNGVDEEKTRKVQETMSIKQVTEMNKELFDLAQWFLDGKPAK